MMEDNIARHYTRVCADIDLDAAVHNVRMLKRCTKKGTKAMAVIKTDAYGHGDVPIARAIYNEVDAYAVATIEEAVNLRENGIDKLILVLGFVNKNLYDLAILNDITIPLFDLDSAKEYANASGKLGKKGLAHIKVDTGMRRIGIEANISGIDIMEQICKMQEICVDGIFTHFATADEADNHGAYDQLDKFNFVIEELLKRGITFKYKHCSNSAGTIVMPEANMDMVRLGISLYGLKPSDDVDDGKVNLKPVLSLKSSITFVKVLPANEAISYGGTYITQKETKVATVSVGYGDGYPRELSNKGYVLVHGKKAFILGRICMDQFMIDVTDIEDVNVGDEVVLVGKDGDSSITVEELSAMIHRFNYEFVCDLGKRIPRRFIKEGKCVFARDYFHENY